jgi:TRAP-type C4-dicarboxylate transport system permease large subunit
MNGKLTECTGKQRAKAQKEKMMFTSIDKALVALIMAVLWLVNYFTGYTSGVTEQTIAGLVGVLTPILVWLVPNKPR